tara:strand:- start:4234 stop:5139 length:906 start_codon:yes stop_codon:yes gene_type:complete
MKNNFKNIIAFKIKKINEKQLDQIPSEKSLKSQAKENKGTYIKSLTSFCNYMDNEDSIYHKIGQTYLFKIRNEKRDVPSSVLNEAVKDKQKEIEQQRGEKLKKKEIKSLKEDIMSALLPKAFIKTNYQEFIIDLKHNFILINEGSLSKADDVISMLKSFVDIELEVINPNFDVITKLTEWANNNDAQEPFDIEDFISLTDIGTGGITEYKKHSLNDYSKEIKSNIDAGKVVNSLRLNWHERIAFTLNEKFIIKQIKTLDSFEENVDETVGMDDDEYTYFNTTISIFVADICELIEDLIKIK